MKQSDLKAVKYLNEHKVFPINNSTYYEFWLVEGLSGDWNVRFDKLKHHYSCTCKNIRQTECSHIKSVRLFKHGLETTI